LTTTLFGASEWRKKAALDLFKCNALIETLENPERENGVAPTLCRTPLAQHSEYTRKLIPGMGQAPGFDVKYGFRHVIMGSLSLASQYHT